VADRALDRTTPANDIHSIDAGMILIDATNLDSSIDRAPLAMGDAPLDGGTRTDSTLGGTTDGALGELVVGAVRQIEVGCGVSCVLVTSGELYCWGIGSTIRNGGSGDERIYPRRMEGFRDIVQFSMTCEAGCAVDRTGSVFCIGSNYMGGLQVGSDAGVVRVAERRLDISNVAQVSWNGSAILVRGADGSVYSRNYVPSVLTRIPVPGTPVSISGGDLAVCAALASGQLACYGAYISSVEPWPASEGMRVVEGLDNAISVGVGFGHYCALKRDGTVWCWGANTLGQTGTAPESGDTCVGADWIRFPCVRRPRQVAGLRDVVEISVGWAMTCALLRDGTVWCWGENATLPSDGSPTFGSIGDGLPNTEICPQPAPAPAHPCRRTPSRVVGLTGAVAISTDGWTSCAALSNGQIWCWGLGSGGALGDGTRISRAVPVPVRWPPMRRDE
jgi:alpha-tubulin suppressor-like RCC1 family protein